MNKLGCVKEACKIADDVFDLVVSGFKEGSFKTETDVAKFISKLARKNEVKLAFPTIVAAGRNGAEIHHKPTDAVLGGFVVLDFGFKYKGYCSDISRTLFVGNPTKEHLQIYNKVKNVQQKSLDSVKNGVSYKDLDLNSRKMFGVLKKNFKHALGHGVGSKIHQKPDVHPKSKYVAKVGDVITIEPGLYFGGRFGIRIEDTVVVMRNRCEILTKSDKKLIVIKK